MGGDVCAVHMGMGVWEWVCGVWHVLCGTCMVCVMHVACVLCSVWCVYGECVCSYLWGLCEWAGLAAQGNGAASHENSGES